MVAFIARVMSGQQRFDSANILLQLARESGVVAFAIDAIGHWTHLCPTWTTLTGWVTHGTLGKPSLGFIHPADHQVWGRSIDCLITGQQPIRLTDLRLKLRSGAYQWVQARLKATFGADGQYQGVIGTLVDATERKRAEILNRGERSVMTAMARGACFEDVLGLVCNVFEQQAEGSSCSILLVSPDGQHLHHAAGPRLPAAYRAALSGVPIGPNEASCGTAAFTGKPVIAEDIATDQRWSGVRELALSHGLRACWSFPFKAASGTVKGVFAVYRSEPKSPEEWEQDLARSLANMAMIAVDLQEVAETLRQNDERYALAVRAAGVGVWDIDLVRRTVYWSPRHREIFGLRDTEEPVLDEPLRAVDQYDRLGETLERVIHPEDRDRVQRAYAAHLEHGTPYEIQFRIQRRNGETHWVYSHAEAVRDVSGQAVRITGCILDVTERVATKTQIQESEQRFRDFADAASDWMWETDADLRLVFLAERGSSLLGINQSDLLGKTCWEASTENTDQPKWEAHVSTLKDHRPFRDFEYIHRTQDDDVRILRISGIPVFSPDGKFLGYRGTGTDITQQRKAEEALIVRERQLLEAQRIAKLGNWEWRLDTQALEWSDEVYRICGVSRDSFLPSVSNVIGLYHPDDREIVRHSMERLISDRSTCDYRCRIVRPDGEVRYLWIEGQCQLTETGEVSHVFGICQDVTEQRQIEKTLRAARDAAQQASRAKSAFLANMSHELRTPLNAIIGFADLLSAEYTNVITEPSFREHLEDIGSSGRHLLALINDILDVAKFEAGRTELVEEVVDVGRALAEAIKIAQQAFPDCAPHIGVSIPSPAPVLLADARRLRQVLINLLSNALKFTPAGGRIAVNVAPNERTIDIAVADTGMGIPPEKISKIGQPFVQLDDALARQYVGSGLGLHISKVLVEQHGGSLNIDSQLETGTTITVRLPRERVIDIPSTVQGISKAPPRSSEEINVKPIKP